MTEFPIRTELTVAEQDALARAVRWRRVVALLALLISVVLAGSGPSDTAVAGASTGDGCGGWRSMVAEVFPGEVDKACRVLLCESRGDPGAVSATDDHGLLQINAPTWNRPGHPDEVAHFIGVHWDRIYDGWSNLVMAQKVRHFYGWEQWACR